MHIRIPETISPTERELSNKKCPICICVLFEYLSAAHKKTCPLLHSSPLIQTFLSSFVSSERKKMFHQNHLHNNHRDCNITSPSPTLSGGRRPAFGCVGSFSKWGIILAVVAFASTYTSPNAFECCVDKRRKVCCQQLLLIYFSPNGRDSGRRPCLNNYTTFSCG